MENYKQTLRALQIELVKLHRHLIACDERILVIMEGRDAAGKDGVIKRITQHLSPRETRVVALGKPSERDLNTWYFQRYVPHLPASQEFVIFNRSWYNRAGVERVMGFCTDSDVEKFFSMVEPLESMLIESGIKIRKYYLDISKEEQHERLAARERDALSHWKISPIDREAQHYWDDYSAARNEMLSRTHNQSAPWIVVRANDKKEARINLIKDLLSEIYYEGKNEALLEPDRDIIREFRPEMLKNGFLAS